MSGAGKTLNILAIPAVLIVWLLALRLAWEQTVWTWERGTQMVGFQLMHSGSGLLLILCVYASLLWAAATIIAALFNRSLGSYAVRAMFAAYVVGWALICTPYGAWQRLFIWKFTSEQSVDLMTYAAAVGDLSTVKAFLKRGIDINAQGDQGTALHAAALNGELEVIKFLIAQGADINVLNPFGESPLGRAGLGDRKSPEAEALLARHGAVRIRGTEEQMRRVISEQSQKRKSKERLDGLDKYGD
jgi:hypothetical protein